MFDGDFEKEKRKLVFKEVARVIDESIKSRNDVGVELA
jgi:hypothetical protein